MTKSKSELRRLAIQRPEGFICYDCAIANKATVPEHSVVTMHRGMCPQCDKEKSLCSTSDYNWPDGTKAIFD